MEDIEDTIEDIKDKIKDNKDITEDTTEDTKDRSDDNRAQEPDFLDKVHDVLSHSIVIIPESIDSFFSDEKIDEKLQQSRLKIHFNSSSAKGQRPSHRTGVSARLVFPRLEKKLALVIKDISNSLKQEDEDQILNDLSNETEKADMGTYLNWFTRLKNNFQLNSDAGIRFTLPLDPFIRIRFKKYWNPSTNLKLRLMGNVFWFTSKGFGHKWRVQIDRKMSQEYLFRFDNRAFWIETDRFFTFSHGPVIFHKINSRDTIRYGSAVESTSHPIEVQNYKAYLGYRSQFYKDWIYIEVQPEINYPRERKFHFTPAIYFKLETVFHRF